jgi:gliding motility-associated-like protein
VNLGPDTTICNNQTVTLDAGNPGFNYLWSTGAITQTITVNSTGMYYVTVSQGLCSTIDSIHVTVLNPPIVSLGSDKILCNGQYLTLNAGNPGASYLWSDGSILDTLHVTASGQIWVKVSVGTCVGSDTINVTFGNAAIVNLGSDVKLCPGQTITLNAQNPGQTFLWSTGATTQTIVASTTGLYSVSVGTGACIAHDTIGVLVYITPPIPLSNDTFICPGDQVQLTAGKGYVSYSWNPGGGGSNSIIVYQPGTYIVNVVDSNGCQTEGSILIQNFCPSELFVPNSFTPNGDGLNDLFNAICDSCISFHLYIFDRWGETVFETTDIAQGWDGTYMGNNVPQGVYVYRIDYQLYDYLQLLKHTLYGNVNLIR